MPPVSRVALALITALFLPLAAMAQSPSQADLQKIDAGLRLALQAEAASKSGGPAVLLPPVQAAMTTSPRGEKKYGVIVYADDPAALRAQHDGINSVFRRFATARVTASELRALAAQADVRRIAVPGLAHTHNDAAAHEVGARLLNSGTVNNTNYRGQNVLVCVIDTGIDITHNDFVDDDGNTRILYLWDQTNFTENQTPEDRSSTFAGLNFGLEWTAAQIDNGTSDAIDEDLHGTHVAGTAASSGNETFLDRQDIKEYRGMAPEANLVVVKAGRSTSFSNNSVVDGLTYCGQVATNQGRPMVVNLSLGSQAGGHDGTATLDVAVDEVTDGTPTDNVSDPGTRDNFAVVASAGNDGSNTLHVSGTLAAGASDSQPWDVTSTSPLSGVDNQSRDFFYTQFWLDSVNDVTVTVTDPDGMDTASLNTASNGSTEELTPSGGISITSTTTTLSGDRQFEIIVFDWDDSGTEITPQAGEWDIEITNGGTSPTTYHGWTIGKQALDGTFVNGDGTYVVGSPGTSDGAITVGSYVHRWSWSNEANDALAPSFNDDRRDRISTFSSVGPRRDGVVKPEITAPGQHVVSALSSDAASTSFSRVAESGTHYALQGTSMSAPVVAGSVALLLQAADEEGRPLTGNEIRSLLTTNARTDAFTGGAGAEPNATFGYGKLDILAAVTDFLGGSASRELLSYFDTVGLGATSGFVNLANGGTVERAAVRFTPTIDGFASDASVLVQADEIVGDAVSLTGPVNVALYSDDGSGNPDTQIGSTVSISADEFQEATLNAFDIQAASPRLTAGTDYHLVLSVDVAGGEISLATETEGTPSGRYHTFDGTSWSDGTGDLRLRIGVSVVTGVSSVLPVELASFRPYGTKDGAVVEWVTATETNNAGFYVERRSGAAEDAPGGWTEVQFVPGAGTTTEMQRYRVVDASLPFSGEVFAYRLRQVDLDGATSYSEVKTIRRGAPEAVTLNAPYPNPARRTATVEYTLPADGDVTLSLYDLLGRRVKTLADGPQTTGRKRVPLSTETLAPGTYVLRLASDGTVRTRRLTVVR